MNADIPPSKMNELMNGVANRLRTEASGLEHDPHDDMKRGILEMNLNRLHEIATGRAERLEEETGYTPDSDFARTIADKALTYLQRIGKA